MTESSNIKEGRVLEINAVFPDTEQEILVVLRKFDKHFEIATEEKKQQGAASAYMTLTKISAGSDEKEARALYRATIEQIRSYDFLD